MSTPTPATPDADKVVCPHCALQHTLSDDVFEGEATGVKGLFGFGARPAIDSANDWVDQTCTRCDKEFKFNKRTRETRK
jgi:hypothetical protein